MSFADIAWPMERAGDAAQALAAAAGLPARRADLASPSTHVLANEARLNGWMEQVGDWLDVDIEPVECCYADVERMVANAGPALLAVRSGRERQLVAVLSARRGKLDVLSPDLRRARIACEPVIEAIRRPIEEPAIERVETVLQRAGLSDCGHEARRALLRGRLAHETIRGCWLLRLPPGVSLATTIRASRLGWRIGGLLSLHAAQYAAWIASWWAIGRGAFEGRVDPGWLTAWVMLLLTVVPLRALATGWAGNIAIDAGAAVKQRLMAGALRVNADAVRRQGIGQLLGRVMESESVELVALSGGFTTLFALIEVAIATGVLSLGAGGGWHAMILLAWLSLTGVLARRYVIARKEWTRHRREMTHDLVESMVGHQTRIAQQSADNRHEREDALLVKYHLLSRRLDRVLVMLSALVPRAWMVVGVGAVIPHFFGPSDPLELAVAVGGTLLGFRALRGVGTGLAQLVDAAIAWQQVAPMFRAAAERVLVAPPVDARPSGLDGSPLARLADVSFRHDDRPQPVLQGANLVLRSGDRVLLEGDSGSGKSTLGAILSGLREPTSGLVLAGGLDRHALGQHGWREHVVCAPQFHENHIFSATLAFNLLMGRDWPPSEQDLHRAKGMCSRLGLDPLLERMPGGLHQPVGETGWQLSHGERSRVFVARALLQDAPVVVLDESLAALDPETLSTVLNVIEEHADAVLLILHP